MKIEELLNLPANHPYMELITKKSIEWSKENFTSLGSLINMAEGYLRCLNDFNIKVDDKDSSN
jgi:hypothetical protein